MAYRVRLGMMVSVIMNLAILSPSFASGDIEPKDSVQNPGPGGLDAPMEKLPKSKPVPTPSPAPQPKVPEKPKA